MAGIFHNSFTLFAMAVISAAEGAGLFCPYKGARTKKEKKRTRDKQDFLIDKDF
jgi:hypothetical protein